MLEKRSRIRHSSHLTCEVISPAGRFSGLVRDLTHRGLFIQTIANPQPNSIVEILFSGIGDQPTIRVEAGVARKRVAPPRLQAVVPSGIGLEVIPPVDEFERWLVSPRCPALTDTHSMVNPHGVPQSASLSASGTAPHNAAPTRAMKAYRFRLVRHDQKGSQVLTIRCETPAGARARALARAGVGWKIADMQGL